MKNENKQVNIFLPFHIGSGNRGCEAITRATVELLRVKKNRIHVLTNEIDEDRYTGLDKLVCLKEYKENWSPCIQNIAVTLERFLHRDILLMIRYYKFLKCANHGDFVMITGGDLYCYPELEWQLRWVCKLAKWRGCKLILWGCSIDEKRLSKKMVHHLKEYDKIYVRESYTRKNLESRNISKVKQIPDPAFMLEAVPCSIPEKVKPQNVIGINISNYTNQNGYSINTVFGKNILNLIRYILENSQFQILLIPHVFWKGQDDRILLKKIYNRYKESGRIFLLDSKKLSYCQIRYAISNCRFFIGSRTHSMISAYIMGVPSLALGYSVKSKGIHKDLMLPSELMINCNELKGEKEILQRYLYLVENEINISQKLKKSMCILEKGFAELVLQRTP